MIKTSFSFLGGFIVGVIIILGWNAYTDRLTEKEIPATDTIPNNIIATTTKNISLENLSSGGDASAGTSDISSSEIVVTTQPYGKSVNVSSVNLKSDGWVVVHEEKDGLISNALGAIRKDIGSYKNVTIPLLRETTSKTRYWIVLYSDNKDRQFNLESDFPLKDKNDNPIMSSFKTK